MQVFLTGATGFIGGRILSKLVAAGHQVTCLLRGAGAVAVMQMEWPQVRVVQGELTQPGQWADAVAGHDVVINAVVIIRQTSQASFQAVHTDAPLALFEAAKRGGVKKVVQISACGADEQAASQYHTTKRAADEALKRLGLPFVVLRPWFVYGPGDQSMTFFRSLAALPLTLVPGDGQYRVQPVQVDDLAQAVLLAVEKVELQGVFDVGGADALTFDEMLDELARTLGKPTARKWHVPWSVMQAVAKLTDLCGGRGPISGEELGMLRRGNEADIQPCRFAAGLARNRVTTAELWAARLAHLRVPLRCSIAFIWLATGIISMCFSAVQGYELLEDVGITGPLADVSLYGTSLLEIAMGLATLFGIRVRWMGMIQLVLMAGFMAILTFGTPELWLHQFGPLTKNIPIIAGTLVMMAWHE